MVNIMLNLFRSVRMPYSPNVYPGAHIVDSLTIRDDSIIS